MTSPPPRLGDVLDVLDALYDPRDAQAWDAVGDFCGISTWHPLVSACELTEVMGAKLRRITLTNGGTD